MLGQYDPHKLCLIQFGTNTLIILQTATHTKQKRTYLFFHPNINIV